MLIKASKLLAEVDYRYGPGRAIWPDGRQLEIKDTDSDLDLSSAQINYLPKGLKVGGYLNLRGSKITALPEGLKVSSYLYLHGTTITESQVPKHLKDKCRW